MSSLALEGDRVPLTRWLAVLAVAVGIFSLVTAEQLPIGLLTSVGSALEVSEGTAGLIVTVPGIVAAISAPLLPVAVGRLDRRLMLIGLIRGARRAGSGRALRPALPTAAASHHAAGGSA